MAGNSLRNKRVNKSKYNRMKKIQSCFNFNRTIVNECKYHTLPTKHMKIKEHGPLQTVIRINKRPWKYSTANT